MHELWDVYGEDYLPIKNRVAVRGKHDLGLHEYHLVVYAWIISSDNRVIISKRQKPPRRFSYSAEASRR